MTHPYREEEFVDMAELIRAHRFDHVGADGDFEIDPAMLEIDPPSLRDRMLTTVGHPDGVHALMYPEIAERLRSDGYRMPSAHALLRWALTAEIRLKGHQTFFVAALDKLYFIERIKDIPHWDTYYVPAIFFRAVGGGVSTKEFCLTRSHSRDGKFKGSPGPCWHYLVYRRAVDCETAP